MKIYHLSSAPFSGGAARAGFRLHEGLLREPGVDSLWLDIDGTAHGPGIELLHKPKSKAPLLQRLRFKKWARITQTHFQTPTRPTTNPIGWGSIEMLEKLPKPDAWNLHWVSWFLDWENLLPWMAEQAPIVWTLHDLNPLRGIWHYDPQAEERTPLRLRYEAMAMEMKRRALAKIPKDRITFVGPSKWMVEECRKSPVTTGFRVEHIPYGLDTSAFAPQDQKQAKNIFGIGQDDFVIGFIADHIHDRRKGVTPLLNALKQVAKGNAYLHLMTVGNGRLQMGDFRNTHLGPIQSDRLLSFFYSACDVFACPSLQDNLPNTVLESLACGVPAVAYDTGGLPDMVEDGKTGRLAGKPGDADSLSHVLKQMLAGECNVIDMRQSSREVALSRYQLEIQAGKYFSLYQDFYRTKCNLAR
jgi:glycosyltransferase involved in cell wall biosynthesis